MLSYRDNVHVATVADLLLITIMQLGYIQYPLRCMCMALTKKLNGLYSYK